MRRPRAHRLLLRAYPRAFRDEYGAELMHPMTTLLDQLIAAQSAAVRGSDVNEATVQEALDLVRLRAAEQGFAPAQFNVGNMYANGIGTAQDYFEAALWFRQAAEQAIVSAMAARSERDLGRAWIESVAIAGEGGRLDQALEYSSFASAALARLEQAESLVATLANNWGTVYYRMGRYQEARPHLERALSLRKTLLVKHLKAWDAAAILRTDFFSRALPWTELLLRRGKAENDLNVTAGARVVHMGLPKWPTTAVRGRGTIAT